MAGQRSEREHRLEGGNAATGDHHVVAVAMSHAVTVVRTPRPTIRSYYGPRPALRTDPDRAPAAYVRAMTTIANSTTARPAAPVGLVPIRPFSDLTTDDVPYAGGKGANLGQLTRMGLAVPPGFVVGAPALRVAAEDARAARCDSEMPAWLMEAIGAAYRALCHDAIDGAVAVRSSAIAEDAASASFAGINETFLNVRGREAVIDAVQRCRHSPFGAGIDIAVVVQRQIRSARAGVMFTSDPATGERDHLVIEGPDRHAVEKSTMTIVTRPVRPIRTVLTDEEVLRLAELGMAIEREYGSPQATEWAFDPEGSIWLLQSRPVAV
jgi:pyruvate,water dikinase